MAGNKKGGGIKQLALAHVEKVVMLLIVGAAGYLAYASLGIERIEVSKDDLSDKVRRTTLAYEESRWDDAPAENTRLSREVASNDIDALPQEAYLAPPITLAVVPPTVDRTDPELLAPTDLEVTALTGIFAFESEKEAKARQLDERRKQEEEKLKRDRAREAGGDEVLSDRGVADQGEKTIDDLGRKIRPIEGRARQEGVTTTGYERFETLSVACVTAKAPISEQVKIYEEALQEARGYDPGNDIPRYLGLVAERAEVLGDDTELKWEPIYFGGLKSRKRSRGLTAFTVDRMIADWIPWPEPMIDPRYEHPVLTMPLPPLVQQSWGPEVLHSEAKTAAEAEAEANAKDADATDPGEATPEELDEFGLAGRDRRGPSAPGRSGRGGFGGGEFGGRGGGGFGGGFGGGEFGGGRGGFGGGEFGGGFGGGGFGGGGGGRGPRRSVVGAEYTIDPEIDFAMIRFWDFAVAPGRQYKYRVKLLVVDVNATADPSSLAPEVVARLKAQEDNRRARPRVTEWSDSSPVVSIPMAGDTFVAGAKRIKDGVDLLVQSYDLDANRRAMKAAHEQTFGRGAVMNLVEDTEIVSPDGRFLVEIDSFEFRTDLTLCDYQGGEELPGKKKAPVRVLLMDAGGRLYVRHELDDEPVIRAHRETFEENKNGGGGGFPGGRGGGEFGGFGSEFGGGF